MRKRLEDFRRVRLESGLPWAATLAAERLGLPAFQRLWRPRRVAPETLLEQLREILQAWGMSPDNAERCATRILYADLRAIDSHGAAMMPFYDRRRRDGGLCLNPEIAIVEESPATALVDGGGGLGHLAGDFAMTLAIGKARETGIAAVGVRNSWHFGAAGAYAADAAAQGMIGFSTTATPTPSVVPTGAREPRLGTNPIAFVAPGENGPSFALDMATSTVSRGKLLDRWRQGRRLPNTWAVDAEGQPVQHGRRAFEERRLTPLGSTAAGSSHKGYGLAVMVEVLSTVLTGAGSPGSENGLGHFFLALDPRRFRSDGSFGTALDALVDHLRSAPELEPSQPVQVAGDPERAASTERTRNGIPLSRHIYEDLRHLALASNASFVLERP